MAIVKRLQDLKDKATGGGGSRRGGGGRKSDSHGFSFGTALEDLIAFAGTLRGQAKQRAQGEMERLAQALDLVTRREFEAVRAIAIAARAQAEELATQLNGGKHASKAKAPAKTRAPARKGASAKPRDKAKPATRKR